MVPTQLGQVAMMTTDLAFIGAIGPDAVAAAALAGRVYVVSVVSGIGLLGASASCVARAFRADNSDLIRRSLRMALWTALLLSLPIMVVQLNGEEILLALGQAPGAARLAQQYLSGVAWGTAPVLSFLAIRGFMGTVDRPQPVLWIMLTAIPMNALLVYLLIYGKLGLPRLELFGAGLATTLVNCATFLAGLWFATLCRPFRDYHVLAQLWRLDWPLMWQMWDWGADHDHPFSGVRNFVCHSPTHGADQHRGTCRQSGHISSCHDHVHDPLRHQHGGDCPRCSSGRPQ